MGGEGYSPSIVAKIEFAGANESSFQVAAKVLEVIGEFRISTKHVQRIAERLGRERREERDAAVEAFKKHTLKPSYRQFPVVAAVHLDAGKIQLRQEDGPPGVKDPHWGDTKVGCFLTYAAPAGDEDPQPLPPAAFVDRSRVARLCREMERIRGRLAEGEGSLCEEIVAAADEDVGGERWHPARLVRTAVATTGDSEAFGWMVAAEAGMRGFYRAKARAVVGDGGNWIGPLGEMHFPGWKQILDFLHLLTHLYAGATAAYVGRGKTAWKRYESWVRWAWAGEVEKVIEGLEAECRRLGPAPAGAGQHDARKVVSLTLEYVKSNAGRMDYANYRRAGLPITSAPVESLIKQFNQRVKGTEKFWLSGGAESILQSRAAYLSEDGRAREFYNRRPRSKAVGRGRLKVPA